MAMMRTFLIGMMLALGVAVVAALVVRREVIIVEPAKPAAVPITISEARAIRLQPLPPPTPNQGDRLLFAPREFIFIGNRASD